AAQSHPKIPRRTRRWVRPRWAAISIGNLRRRILSRPPLYHLRLRCFVVVDLKMEAFKPEFAGKMNPVRYQYHEPVPLRLRPPKSQGRQPLRWRNTRLGITDPKTQRRRSAVHGLPSPAGTCLLRGMPITRRRIQAREVFEKCLG